MRIIDEVLYGSQTAENIAAVLKLKPETVRKALNASGCGSIPLRHKRKGRPTKAYFLNEMPSEYQQQFRDYFHSIKTINPVFANRPASASTPLLLTPAPEGRKDDDGKNRFDLLPPDALSEVVRVYTFGAGKYGDRNWEQGLRWGRVFAAICRHLFSWWRGEDHDPETGINHLAHAAWGCLTLLAYDLRGMDGFDDRKA